MIARTIGSAAREMVNRDGAAALAGQTSRGAFLALASGEPLFLSLESFRGPLTVNVSGEAQRLKALPIRTAARIQSQNIIFDQHDLSILTAPAQTWQAPPRPDQALPIPARQALLQEVRLEARRMAAPAGLISLLDAPGAGEHPLQPSLEKIEASLRQRQVAPLAAALLPFLGYGNGLTPSGDDLVLGVMLALNRWGDTLAPGLDVEAFNRRVLSAALQLTTTLSASLIACTAQGQADERLVAGLDSLLCGGSPAAALVAGIAGWGNTSGLDVLAGMLLAIAS